MRIYTYYEVCPTHDVEAEMRLLLLWKEHWTAIGYEPFVLNEFIARQHPYFEDYHAAVSKLPTVNSADYEKACYLRHLALAQVGGGWLADYDVFAVRGKELPVFSGEQLNRLQLLQTNCICPCLFYATREVAERMCRTFAAGQHGLRKMGERDHYSDQYALVDLVEMDKVDWIEQSNHLLGYGDDGWEQAEFVHFSNSATRPRGKNPRWQHIPQILGNLK